MKAGFQGVFLIELLSCEVSKIILASALSGPRHPFSKSLPNEACLFLSLNPVCFYATSFLTLPSLMVLPCSPLHVQSSTKVCLPSWEEWTLLPHESSPDTSGYVSELCRRTTCVQPQPSVLCLTTVHVKFVTMVLLGSHHCILPVAPRQSSSLIAAYLCLACVQSTLAHSVSFITFSTCSFKFW